jgi:hypothetical protein
MSEPIVHARERIARMLEMARDEGTRTDLDLALSVIDEEMAREPNFYRRASAEIRNHVELGGVVDELALRSIFGLT